MDSYRCAKCGIDKPITDFWRTLSGHEHSCKQCRMVVKYDQRLEKRVKEGLPVRRLTVRQSRELEEVGLRFCPGCGRVLPLDRFSHCRGKQNNAPHCRECNADMQRERNAREDVKTAKAAAYAARKPGIRNSKLVRQYGITLSEYECILRAQKGVCAVCGKSPAENGKSLAVDHNHATNTIRGLLCNNCNVAVGFLQDAPELALEISRYLTTKERTV